MSTARKENNKRLSVCLYFQQWSKNLQKNTKKSKWTEVAKEKVMPKDYSEKLEMH